MLTVIEKTIERRDRYCLWRCHCDCGGEILVNTKQLKRGTVTNCGCVPKKTVRKGPVAENLEGVRFEKLTVLRRADNENGRVRWLCQCDCGNTCIVAAHDLKAGKTKSCGCMRRQKGKGIVDIKGKRFGRLRVLYPTEKRDKKGSVYWRCRCDCGNETDVTEDGLMYGNNQSCGCLKRETQRDIVNRLHHIDGTCVEWLEKRKHRSDNTSGFRGVYQRKNGRFRVNIGFKKQRFYIGSYQTFEEAVRARLEAEEKIHDRFVKAYYLWKEKNNSLADCEKLPFVFEVEKKNGQLVVITNMESLI